jgi:hypothetical protein
MSKPALVSEQDILAPTPMRDLDDLTRRLRDVALKSETRASPLTPTPHDVGYQDTFWIVDTPNKRYMSFKATIRYVTPRVYMYVQDTLPFDLEHLKQASEQFEQRILPTDHSTFGLERATGYDGDARISIVNGKIPGVGGYFSPEDEYSARSSPYSNQRHALYMNVEASQPGTDGYLSTLAHEFQHMIEFSVRPQSDSWLNEGASMFAQRVNGLPVGGVVPIFFGHPDTQLNAWAADPAGARPHYGASFLWLQYFADRNGGPTAIRDVLASKRTDLGAFAEVLSQRHADERLPDMFADWAVANYLNDPRLDAGKYGYADIKGHAVETAVMPVGDVYTNDVLPYAARYLVVAKPAGARVRFQGETEGRLMHHALPGTAHSEWWSNRADNMDSLLTRKVDLSDVASATLEFDTWYDIEAGYDYWFLEVSKDGVAWKTLASNHATSDNPNGANFGFGFTGVSGDGASGSDTSSATWQHESVDLAPYVGSSIQLRFEYVTDAAYSGPGVALANIRIPALHWNDDPGHSDGWTAVGWLATDNRVPVHFQVRGLLIAHDTTVSAIPVDDNGNGMFVAAESQDLQKLVLVVIPFVAKTSEPVRFSVIVEKAG